jgi:hypothetical protein
MDRTSVAMEWTDPIYETRFVLFDLFRQPQNLLCIMPQVNVFAIIHRLLSVANRIFHAPIERQIEIFLVCLHMIAGQLHLKIKVGQS